VPFKVRSQDPSDFARRVRRHQARARSVRHRRVPPPHVFEYEWKVAPVAEMPLGQNAIFRYELTPQGSSTLLTVTYRRLTKQSAPGFLPGTHAFLDRLEAQLDEEPLPDWTSRFTELLSQYPAWTK